MLTTVGAVIKMDMQPILCGFSTDIIILLMNPQAPNHDEIIFIKFIDNKNKFIGFCEFSSQICL